LAEVFAGPPFFHDKKTSKKINMHFGTKSALTDAAFWAFVLKKSIFLFLIKRKKNHDFV